jgi:hypothetical protein
MQLVKHSDNVLLFYKLSVILLVYINYNFSDNNTTLNIKYINLQRILKIIEPTQHSYKQ